MAPRVTKNDEIVEIEQISLYDLQIRKAHYTSLFGECGVLFLLCTFKSKRAFAVF